MDEFGIGQNKVSQSAQRPIDRAVAAARQNADYPYYMIRDRFAGPEARDLRWVKRGQGKILDRNGAKVAAYRDTSGATILSRPRARILAVSWRGTTPSARGTAPVTARGSPPREM